MNNEKVINVSKRAFVLLVIAPICFVWDAFYWLMKKFVLVLDKIDEFGNNYLDRVKGWLNE